MTGLCCLERTDIVLHACLLIGLPEAQTGLDQQRSRGSGAASVSVITNGSARNAGVIGGFLCVFLVSSEVVGDLNKHPPYHLCLRSDCHLLRDLEG